MDLAGLKAVRPALLEAAARELAMVSAYLDATVEDGRSRVLRPLEGGSWQGPVWQGVAQQAAARRAGLILDRLEEARNWTRRSQQAISEFTEVITDARRMLAKAEDLASANQVKLGDDGSVTYAESSDRSAEGAAREVNAIALRALRKANEADQLCAARLLGGQEGVTRLASASSGAFSQVLRGLAGEVANFWSGGPDDGMPWGSVLAGLNRARRTAVWLRAGLDASKFPTFNTGLFGRGTAGLCRLLGMTRTASWLGGPAATLAFRRIGIAAGVVSTGLDLKNLWDQGNPIDAYRREGAGYLADVARTGFSASTTAFMVAPSPVTGAAVVVTGVAWAGLEIYDHWDEVSEAAGDAWDSVSDAAGDAWDTISDVGGALNPLD